MTVTVYTKPGCMQCTATIRALNKRDINVDVVDIEQDEDRYAEAMAFGYRQLPIVSAGEMHWSGFNPTKIQQVSA